jgi:hypothetical protein
MKIKKEKNQNQISCDVVHKSNCAGAFEAFESSPEGKSIEKSFGCENWNTFTTRRRAKPVNYFEA